MEELMGKFLKTDFSDKENQWVAIVHPMVWNGCWSVRRVIPFFRWLGKRLHSKKIYWIGFQVEWIHGLKELSNSDFNWYGGFSNEQADDIGKRAMNAIDSLVDT